MKRNRPPLDNEDTTLYGEFISSFDAWTGTQGTHSRGSELEQKGKTDPNLSNNSVNKSQSNSRRPDSRQRSSGSRSKSSSGSRSSNSPNAGGLSNSSPSGQSSPNKPSQS